jgi:hypothetical protein
MDYRFDIIHIPGATNVLPDHLSRIYADHRWGEGRGAHLFVRADAQLAEPSISPPNLIGAGGGKGPGKNGASVGKNLGHTVRFVDMEGGTGDSVHSPMPDVSLASIHTPPITLFAITAPTVTSHQRSIIEQLHEKGHFGVMATYERLRAEGHNWPV